MLWNLFIIASALSFWQIWLKSLVKVLKHGAKKTMFYYQQRRKEQ